MIPLTGTVRKGRPERRRRKRVQLARPIIGRIGTIGAVLLDVSESGARIEHYSRLKTGSSSRLRFDWENQTMVLECQIVSCKVHRFSSGDDGLTVYQSGLLFTNLDDTLLGAVRELIRAFTSRGLAEQVANARGVGPVLQSDMPIFRSGVVSSNDFDAQKSEKTRHLIPEKGITQDKGFIRCKLKKLRFERKWTLNPEQPEEGFTVLATEPADQIDLLCETYLQGDRDARAFIRACAELSIREQRAAS